MRPASGHISVRMKRTLIIIGLILLLSLTAGSIAYLLWPENQDPVEQLMLAAAQPDTELLQELRTAPDAPDINTQDKQGRTALFHASRHGRTDNLRFLLAAGADANKADNNGITPLYAAAWFGHTDCVQELLNAPGIAPGATTEFGETAYTAARLNEHEACMQLLRQAQREAALAQLKERYITHSNTWRILAESALLEDDVDTLQLLLDAEVIIPNEPDSEGKIPLDRALRYNSERCAELLLNYQGD